MRIKLLLSVFTVISLFLVSCKNMNVGMVTGKPSYEPSTYGTEALKKVIKDPAVSKRDGVAAAEALAGRKLNAKDGAELLELLKLNRHSAINVALLQTMVKQDMIYLRDDLKACQPQAIDPDTAAELAATVYSFIEDDNDRFEFMKGLLLGSQHANVRARAVRVLSSYKERSEDAFITALEKESSASAAAVMCGALGEFGSAKSEKILDTVANEVNRSYVSDSTLGEKATAETVRAAAVKAQEALKSL